MKMFILFLGLRHVQVIFLDCMVVVLNLYLHYSYGGGGDFNKQICRACKEASKMILILISF